MSMPTKANVGLQETGRAGKSHLPSTLPSIYKFILFSNSHTWDKQHFIHWDNLFFLFLGNVEVFQSIHRKQSGPPLAILSQNPDNSLLRYSAVVQQGPRNMQFLWPFWEISKSLQFHRSKTIITISQLPYIIILLHTVFLVMRSFWLKVLFSSFQTWNILEQ